MKFENMVIIMMILVLFVFGLLYGIILSYNPKYIDSHRYVECMDYYRIIDKWKTPNGFYVSIQNEGWELGHTQTVTISEAEYQKFIVGAQFNGVPSYAKFDSFGNLVPVNLTPISESESGYRDACKVLP